MAGTGKAVIRKLRGKSKPPAPQIRLSPSQERRLVKKLGAQVQAQPLTGTVVPKPGSSVAARSGAFRFRRHLVVFEWIALLLGAGLLLHAHDAAAPAAALGFLAAVAIVVLCRHLTQFARTASLVIASLTALWLPLIALWGRPAAALALLTWVPFAVKWVKHYRWRPEDAAPVMDMTDLAIWNRLASAKKWSGYLEPVSEPGPGVRQYRILLDGAETHMGQVLSEPRRIAAAWGKSVTEAYAEPSPDGVESRGLLTILPRNTLEQAREWDGQGIDHETGMAAIGRFPDAAPSHERYFIRSNGVRHTIICGADGSGKTGLLNLGLSLSATSGFIAPVILDPQEGQALPAWKDEVPYARGVEECMAFLEGLHSGLLARSRDLGRYRWTTEDGDERTGLDFFDPFLTGLPIIEVTLDEASALFLTANVGPKALDKMAAIGKLGRKAGFRLRIAIHVPSLAEFGGNAQALRSILAGGNVLCGRTGDKVTGGMIGVQADPSQLPKYFADGSPTVGLGYGSGPDNRPATPQRWDWVRDPYKVARSAKTRELDDRVASSLHFATAAGAARFPMPSPAALASVPPVADDDGPEGRTCSDAILAVLDGEMTRGQIITKVKILTEATAENNGWGRAKTFSTKAIQNALTAMAGDGRILKPRDGTYCKPKPVLERVK
jgi:hypothetical protein